MKSTEQIVTPSQASVWLGYNTHNRRLDQIRVSAMADDIRCGRWVCHPRCTVVFGLEDGRLVLADGQHKLAAVVMAGIPATMMITYLDPKDDWREIQRNIDSQQGGRSSGQQLGLDGVKNGNRAAAIASMMLDWEAGIRTQASGRNTQSKILQYVHANRVEIDAAISTSDRAMRATRWVPRAAAVSALLFRRADPNAVERFFELVESGADLSLGSPILALRSRLPSPEIRNDQWTHLGISIVAWNAWTAGRSLQRLVIPRTTTAKGVTKSCFPADSFPEIRVTRPRSGGAR